MLMGTDAPSAAQIDVPSHGQSIRRWELLVVLAVVAVVLSIAFREVVFEGRSMLSLGGVPGVMGFGPPYGYDGPVAADPVRIDPYVSAWITEPQTRKVSEAFHDGDIPLWNANMGAGAPLLGAMQPAPFHLLRLPVFIWPTTEMWDTYLVLRFVVGAVLLYYFARYMGLGRPGALTAAIGYTLSGYFFMYSNVHWLDIYLLLPGLLLAVERTVRRGGAFGVILVAVATAAVLLAGMPTASMVTLLVGVGFAGFRTVDVLMRRRRARDAAVRDTALLCGFIAGAALASAILLPFDEYLRHAATPHVASAQFGLRAMPLSQVTSLFMPDLRGAAPTYSGLAVATLALISLAHRRFAAVGGWFFLIVGLVATAKIFGIRGVNDLGRLPVLNLVDYQGHAAPVISLGLAYLAGIAVDGAATGMLRRRAIVVLGTATFVALAILFWLGPGQGGGLSLPSTPEAVLRTYLPVAALLAILVMAALRRWPPAAAWLCLALVSAELISLAPTGIYQPRYDTYARPPWIEFLQRQQEGEERFRLYAAGGLLFPSHASAFDLDDVRSHDALYPARYIEYVRTFVSPLVGSQRGTLAFLGFAFQPTGEGEPRFANNQMFDLMNAKYLVIGGGPLYASLPSPLIDEILAWVGATPEVRHSGFVIDGEEKPALFAHAPSDIAYEVTPTAERHVLRFSIALEPASWSGEGDGVLFEVAVGGSTPTTVFSQWVDPKNNAADRRWFDGAADLSPYLGQPVTLHLRTMPGVDSASDWSGWGDLRLTGAVESARDLSQFELVYEGEVRVYRNRHAFPRAFVVNRVEEAADGEAALARMQQSGFDPSRLAVIEGSIPAGLREELAQALESGPSQVTVTQYEDNRVELEAQMESAGLVLLTDTYYPGWKVYVDGDRAKLYPTDYLFRGVFVSEGEHKIEFVYDPASFKLGVAISVAAVLSLLGLWGVERYGQRKRKGTADSADRTQG